MKVVKADKGKLLLLTGGKVDYSILMQAEISTDIYLLKKTFVKFSFVIKSEEW